MCIFSYTNLHSKDSRKKIITSLYISTQHIHNQSLSGFSVLLTRNKKKHAYFTLIILLLNTKKLTLFCLFLLLLSYPNVVYIVLKKCRHNKSQPHFTDDDDAHFFPPQVPRQVLHFVHLEHTKRA